MSQSGSNSDSPPIPTPPDSPQSTASHQSRHSTISRRSQSHTSDRDRRLATLENELRQSNLTRDRLVRDRDHLDLQVHQLRSNVRDMEVFQHGQRDEITRLETEISTLTHAMGDDPDDLHAQVLQLRTERNDFELHAISAREVLHNAETDRDRLRLEAVQAGDEIRDLQAQISNLERETDDARSESATALASYNRISSSLTRSPSDHGRDPSPSRSTRLIQTQRDRALADLALARANLTQVTSDRDRAFKQLAQATEDRDRALSDRDSAPVTARDQARLDLLTETARTAQLDDDLEVVRLELQEREREMSDLQVAHDQLTVLRDLAESDPNEADRFLTHLASRIRESQATRMPKRERSPPTSPPQLPPSKTPRSDRPVSPPHHQDPSEIEDLDGQEHPDQHEFEGGDDQEHRGPSEIEGEADQERGDLYEFEDEDDQELGDLHEFEGEGDQEHKDQHEFEGPDDQDHRDQSEIESQEDQEHKDHDEFEDSDDQDLEDKHEIPSGGGGSPGDHDSPPPDHGPTTPPPSPPSGHHPTTPPPSSSPPQSPGGSPGGDSPGGGSPIQLNPPLFPAEASVPHYSDVKVFTAAEINPWDPLVVGPVPILVMIQATLTKRMPIPANFLFPHRLPPVRAPQPVVGYCSGLITGANVLALMATEPPLYGGSPLPMRP
ncbi:hypothetical protein PHMEG_00030157 [Phytophthora megakarya]|uniref:Uncharacterized protein n=1 Tax=Phytophthora megakarya TaxID=4795 RepID=A0A225V3F2_9STRA|nr:hypothetical protein PHMEG_00030157 [Phytophthora megakarya]